MSNPPTFNDLKRARNLYNSRNRSRLIGVAIPLKAQIPSLTIPNFTFNFLSIDNNYVATGDELGASDVNQLDFFNANKFIDYPTFEFYSKYRYITTTDYLYDSLYSINGTFRQKSINFNDTIDQVGELTFDRKFYNYNSDIETQSVVLTSYDFSNLQVNLSTNINGITGTTDLESFTVQVTAVHEQGRLLENFIDLNLQGDENSSLTSFNTLSTFDYNIPVDLFTPIINDDYKLTLTSSRNDNVTDNYESTKSLSVNISAAPYIDSMTNSIHTVWSTVSSLSNPLDEYETLSGVFLDNTFETRKSFSDDNKLFYQREFFRPGASVQYGDALDNDTNSAIRAKYRYVNNRTTGYPTYNEAWFLYPYRDIYDLSGVTLTRDDNVTLINGKFGLNNRHFSMINDSSTLKFLTTENVVLTSKIESSMSLGEDAKLFKLVDDITALAALTAGDIKTYKLPLFNNPVNRQRIFPVLIQAGNYNLGKFRVVDFDSGSGINYNEGDEHAALGSTRLHVEDAPLSGGGSVFVGYTSLQSVSSVFAGKKLGFPQKTLAGGDSSSPSFLIHNNELLLLMTFLGASGPGSGNNFEPHGTGPSYGTKGFHDRINDAMDALGREGYQLSAVQMD